MPDVPVARPFDKVYLDHELRLGPMRPGRNIGWAHTAVTTFRSAVAILPAMRAIAAMQRFAIGRQGPLVHRLGRGALLRRYGGRSRRQPEPRVTMRGDVVAFALVD